MAKPVGLDSLDEFIEAVGKLKSSNNEIFYRGHSKFSYKLEPSIYRKFSKQYGVNLEDVISRELIIHNPDSFENERTTLEKLVLMQHSGLPTRLLDITSNPLVALYFCCKSHSGTRGSIYVLQVQKDAIKYYDSDTVSILSNLSRLSYSEKSALNFSQSRSVFNKAVIVKRLAHYIIEEKHHFRNILDPKDFNRIICVKTKKSNPRISAQSGAFLLYGMQDADTPADFGAGISHHEIKINGSKKSDILNQLDKIGINDSTMFPEIDKSAQHIRAKYLGN
jgi:hypothetical protein